MYEIGQIEDIIRAKQYMKAEHLWVPARPVVAVVCLWCKFRTWSPEKVTRPDEHLWVLYQESGIYQCRKCKAAISTGLVEHVTETDNHGRDIVPECGR